MRNKIKSTTFIVMSVFLLLFCYDNANADLGTSNCTANSSASFNFNVQPAITIEATSPVLENICPGCSRTWVCGEGPYIQWDVTGSLDCRYNFTGRRVVHCNGDDNASITTCWKYLSALPDTWEDIGFDNPRTFFNNNGQGFGKFRLYLKSQSATCDAYGYHCWCVDATVDYVCGLIEIEEEPCSECPPNKP